MTAEDWYNEWSFGIKIEWKDLSPETKQFWEDNFNKIYGKVEDDPSLVLQRSPLGT